MTGPLRDNPSFDIVLQAMSGALSVNGEPGQPPTKWVSPLGDLVGGIQRADRHSCRAPRAQHDRSRPAHRRQPDGRAGRHARLSRATGVLHRPGPDAAGAQHPNLVPYGIFPASDGSIVVACLTNSFLGTHLHRDRQPEFTDDARFDTIEKRRDNRERANAIVSEFTSRRSVQELGRDIHAPSGAPRADPRHHRCPVATTAVAREMVVETEHKTLEKSRIVNRPITVRGRSSAGAAAPPVLGEHTEEILKDILGLTAEAIDALRAAKVVA